MSNAILDFRLPVVTRVLLPLASLMVIVSAPLMAAENMSGMMMSGGHAMTMMKHAPMPLRDPHAASDGYTYETVPRPHEADEMNFASLLADRFEVNEGRNGNALAYDVQAWYGRDYDRLIMKAEGDVDQGNLQESRTELLWGHALTSFWDTQLGVRVDQGDEPAQSWLALGVEGLAPYWFDVETTAYLGSAGQLSLRLDVSYELLFTQKLILQPRFEANFYRKSDRQRSRGAGLSNLSAGLRLRYEIRRELAPYIGVEWGGLFGATATAAGTAGVVADDLRAVAGLRFWF